MPGFPKVLKKWIVDCYDYLGLVLISSFVWFGVLLAGMAIIAKTARYVPAPLLLAMTAGLYILILAPLAAGVYSLAKKIIARDDPSVPDIFREAKALFVPAAKLGFWQTFITLVITANAWFYFSRPSIVWKVLGVLVVYAAILWALSATYHFPILIEQRPGTLKLLKRGFLLVLDNLAFTLGVFFVIILLTCFSTLVLIGLPLLFLGTVSLLQTRALRALFVKYDVLPPEREYKPEDERDTFVLSDEKASSETEIEEGELTNGRDNLSRHTGR